MNTLKFYPKKVRKAYEKNIKNAGIKKSPEEYHNRLLVFSLIITILFFNFFFFFKISLWFTFLVFIISSLFFYFRVSLKASARIKIMEQFFPDVISLMASNLRAGITIDRSFLLSARPEFAPLDEEILKTGKEIATGKDVLYSLKNMKDRIDSEKIGKVIMLIMSGLKAGGNIADLLEQTSSNIKEKDFIEKKASSSISMYVIFIFFAVGLGAPGLFALSSVLVDVIVNVSAQVPEAGASNLNVPFTFSQISVSTSFIIYFSLFFIIASDFISSMVIGLVNKGESKAGLRLFIPLVAISLSVFFGVRIFLSNFLAGAFSLL